MYVSKPKLDTSLDTGPLNGGLWDTGSDNLPFLEDLSQ